MKQHYSLSLIVAGLLVLGSIITGFVNADMNNAPNKRGKFMAKKTRHQQ